MMTMETMDASGPGRGGRMSRQRKRDAVLRLLRGEDLETVSRALGLRPRPRLWENTWAIEGLQIHVRRGPRPERGGLTPQVLMACISGPAPRIAITRFML
jgi:hypothetical protein